MGRSTLYIELRPKDFSKAWNFRPSKTIFSRLSQAFDFVLRWAGLFFVALYRTVGASHLGGQCRMNPSCSEYAVQTLRTERPHLAVVKIVKRISKCHPWGPTGDVHA